MIFNMNHKNKKNHDSGPAADVGTPPANENPARSAAEGAEPSPVAEAALDSAQSEMNAMKDQMLRLQADFDNFRKRVRRDAEDQRVGATEGLMKELLPVLDHFELGLKAAREQGTPDAVQNGLQLVLDQMLAALGRFGLRQVEGEESQPFDPHQHESVALVPSAGVPRDHIVAKTRRGYRLGERLLRAPQVVVSTGEPGSETDEG